MTTHFRLDRVVLQTDAGDVSYAFPSRLTVLAGPVGVGKSTLFDVIKFALGGSATLSPIVIDHATSVTVDIQVGAERYSISRSFDEQRRRVARVVDLRTRERLPDLPVDAGDSTLSALLLEAMGLPADMRAAAQRAGSTNAGARVTFQDVLRYMYVPQSDISTQIAGSGEGYLAPKRKAVFELLFGLTDPDILHLRSQKTDAQKEVDSARQELDTVRRFLADSRTPDREELAALLLRQREELVQAQTLLQRLREEVDPVEDRQTRLLRDLLTQSEREGAAAADRATRADREAADLRLEARRINQELERLQRLRSAGHLLANIEFVTCPRCQQSLRDRDNPADVCRLCLQPEPLQSSQDDVYEELQLRAQQTELAEQVDQLTTDADAARAAAGARSALIADLSREIDERVRTRVAPRMQAYADATATVARLDAYEREVEVWLRQWDRVGDLEQTHDAAVARRERLVDEIARRQSDLEERREEVLNAIDQELDSTVRAVRVPGVEAVRLDRTSYLPLLNDVPFDEFSPAGGGIRTMVQVAYWITLTTVASRLRDTRYPSFLLLDSPRTALNGIPGADGDLAAGLYARVVTQVDAAEGRLQVVIGDNELPAAYRRGFEEIELSYERPAVYTVAHRGPAAAAAAD